MGGAQFLTREKREYPNGAVGWAPGGPFDCLGPWAKVERCPVEGTGLTRTCYATGYATDYFSIPARCSIGGRTIKGFFTLRDGNPVFVPFQGQLS